MLLALYPAYGVEPALDGEFTLLSVSCKPSVLPLTVTSVQNGKVNNVGIQAIILNNTLSLTGVENGSIPVKQLEVGSEIKTLSLIGKCVGIVTLQELVFNGLSSNALELTGSQNGLINTKEILCNSELSLLSISGTENGLLNLNQISSKANLNVIELNGFEILYASLNINSLQIAPLTNLIDLGTPVYVFDRFNGFSIQHQIDGIVLNFADFGFVVYDKKELIVNYEDVGFKVSKEIFGVTL